MRRHVVRFFWAGISGIPDLKETSWSREVF
ncbi:hypothetical protein Taro_011987 [Colocasia esculenta]|uniref:Uncharacterized protein n=1 Tax=Colocasia esculenta TaxID=4460 RepID=A0A843U7I2_COLES|nr:hypothetical protein [Colocasia esculenta]